MEQTNVRHPFVIIDGNSLMHRAFHALPLLTNEAGVYTNAVYGFLGMMLRVIEEERADSLAVAFDLHGPTFRHTDYKDYKAGRKPTAPELAPQFSLIQDCLTAMHVQILTSPSFEADDILGTMARRCEQAGIPALLVTGDRDALQLATSGTTILYTKRGVSEVVRYTPEQVLLDFGVPPERIPDLKGLMGDASDNIPGIPGIGEKTAVKLLGAYGTLEEVLAHTDDLRGKQRERLIEGAASGMLSKKIATITREVPLDIPLEACRLHALSDGRDFLAKLGMKSLLARLDKLAGDSVAAKPERAWPEPLQLTNPETVHHWIEQVQGTLTAVLLMDNGFSLAGDDALAFIPFREGFLGDGLEFEEAVHALKPLFDGQKPLLLYDAKYLMTQLSPLGVTLRAPFEDERIVAYLLAPQVSQVTPPEHAGALLDAFSQDYAALCAQQMESLYRTIELPLVRTLFAMEREGFRVNREELLRLGAGYAEQIEALRQEVFSLTGGEAFNLNSTQQLGEVLFERLGLPAKKKTSRGYSTDAEVLQQLSPLHPAIDKILQYRQIAKLKSTYIDGLLSLMGGDGRIHTTFDQTTTATGRISSSEPNLQNIPVRTQMGREIRRAFVAREGHVLLDADYSQIELRLLAHLSQDSAMCDAFQRGQDIHRRTASEVFGVPLEEVTREMRSSAKAVNFGIVYGISDFGLANNLQISRKEAASFIARYFERYPAVHRFMEACVAQGKSEGYSFTMFGRRRPLPELSSPNYTRRQFGERAAMNTPVQGAAADIIKIAMNAVSERLAEEGYAARLILQVHDELIVECPEAEVEAVSRLLRECMEGAAELRVPLIAEVTSGASWYEAK